MHKQHYYLHRGHVIKPLTLTRFWHRRICEAIIVITTIILALYFWAYFNGGAATGMLLINEPSAVAAGIALIASIISYFWAPKKYIFWGSLTAYVILCATAALLVINTGGAESPFIALWMVVAIFAGVFGTYGLLPLFIAITAYLILQAIGGTLSRQEIIIIVLTGELPLFVSYLIWHNKLKPETTGDKAYRELATELSEVAGKSEVVINAIADGVIALNNQGIIQLINPAAQQIIGWGKQDALSLDYKSVLKLVDANSHELEPATDPIVQALGTNKEVTSDSLSLVTSSGKKILISIVVSPVGALGSGVIVVFRDITKDKAEERQQAEFISTAAHEMRTPVASIEGYLGLALNPATAQVDAKARDFITKAHESAQHLGRLFQDLLDVSKADDGRLSNNPKVVDVVNFAHDIVQGLRPKAEEKGLHVFYKPLPDDDQERSGERTLNPVYYANVDNDHLREVLANLIDNAIKYTPKGDIIIDVTGDTEHITISIADSGIGIPKEDMAHLFQKFYRVDNSDTREIGGTGLGLYLCRRLTETMNGRIWAESEYKHGSTFYVEIPRIDHEEATRLIETASTEQPAPEISTTHIETPMTMPDMSQINQAPAPPMQPVPPITPPTIPTGQQSPPNTSGEAIYTNAPVATVVQQLQSLPPQAPITQEAPSPLAQQPYITQPQTYLAPAKGPRINTPLTSIEQDPSQYIRYRPGNISVPPRKQN